MHAQKMEYTDEVAVATAPIYKTLEKQYKPDHWRALAPYIYEINRLKKEKGAVILAHNYMTPDIFYGVGDIVGDSLKLAQEAAKTEAQLIVQCGVHFMAETSKILCPEKTVLIPDMKAGCSLSESITSEDVRKLKAAHPGVPIVTYVNTSADVKAESDVCCTSSNALRIIEKLREEGHKRVMMTPDMYLAQNVANTLQEKGSDIEVLFWEGSCMVHERFTKADIERFRKQHGKNLVILAHPECPPEILDEADYAGSTAQMNDYILEKQPPRAMLLTECSMSANIASNNPNVTLIGTCQLCPHMQRITLPKILKSLQNMEQEVIIDAAIADKARKPIERMLELSQ